LTDISFAPKEVIPPQVCRLEVLDADKAETYGPQVYLKLRVVGGEREGHTFNDYASRDETTGQIRQGSKAWTIFEACLGRGFHERPGVSLKSLIGKRFVAQVTQTRTGSRNKVEFGTVGPLPPEEKNSAVDADNKGDGVKVSDLPF
jgi:hypothetical protein